MVSASVDIVALISTYGAVTEPMGGVIARSPLRRLRGDAGDMTSSPLGGSQIWILSVLILAVDSLTIEL